MRFILVLILVGFISSVSGFTIVAGASASTLPTVTSISPNSGSTLGGTSVTITGTNFTGATAVHIGGLPVTSFSVDSPTSVTAVTAPSGGECICFVRVITPAGASPYDPISPVSFYYNSPFAPTVTSIAPTSGTTLGGTSVTITGTNLTGATAVTIGGAAATGITVVSPTSITATTPAGTAGTASVLVTTPGGTNAANTLYTYFNVRASVEETHKVIAKFMLNRANNILGNQPDMIDFLEGTNSGGGGPLGYLDINGNDNGMDLAFSSSLSKVDRARAESLQQLATRRVSDAHNALSFAAETPNAAYGGNLADNGYMPTRKFDIWTQIYGSTTNAGDSDSSFWIGYLGAHYFVTPDMIIGGLVQLDWADEDNGTSGSSADGQGWMIGPYVAGRITGTGLNYEARASWGRSDNNVSPLGTYTDEFETERWLASFKLKGDYMLNTVTFRPSVSVSYFEEEQESYTDSLSNNIPSQTISLGEVRFGPEFIRDIALSDGSLFRPSIGISGVWNFGVEEGASPQGYALGNDDLRARLDAGFSLSNPNGMMMSVAAYYDGLAIDEYESMGGKVNVSVPIR